jgi:hypothetical protein
VGTGSQRTNAWVLAGILRGGGRDMGGATGLSQEQLLALGRIAKLPQAKALHLVGGSAIAVHFGHRRSEDLDIFSILPDVDLHAVRASLAVSVNRAGAPSDRSLCVGLFSLCGIDRDLTVGAGFPSERRRAVEGAWAGRTCVRSSMRSRIRAFNGRDATG